jgi:hypothetical protein
MLGGLGSGLGLVLIGIIGMDFFAMSNFAFLSTGVLITGALILGLFHGFINAPVITHITTTKSAKVMGMSNSISVFRSLERFGQIFGPIIVAQLLVLFNNNSITYSVIGLATIIFSLFFIINIGGKKTV